MTETIRWGVLGNATIARVCVIPAIQKSCNGKVRALATSVPSKAKEVADKNKIQYVFESYDSLLADPAIDAVYIPLPNHLHCPWSLKALKAGKHVLCEKPLACNMAEARMMADTAEKAGVLLMEAFMYRFHPRNRQIKMLVDTGSIGKPCLVRSAFCYSMDKEILKSSGNARLKPELGGGALLDVGCYSVSLARWMFGVEPTHLQAQAIYHHSGIDVHFVGSLRFPDSGLATVEASFISALQQTYSVVGSQGAIELPHNAFIPWEKDAAFTVRGRDEQSGQQHVIPGADEYQLMVEHFAEAVLGKMRPAFSIEDSVSNMRVLDALAEAAQTGKTVELSRCAGSKNF